MLSFCCWLLFERDRLWLPPHSWEAGGLSLWRTTFTKASPPPSRGCGPVAGSATQALPGAPPRSWEARRGSRLRGGALHGRESPAPLGPFLWVSEQDSQNISHTCLPLLAALGSSRTGALPLSSEQRWHVDLREGDWKPRRSGDSSQVLLWPHLQEVPDRTTPDGGQGHRVTLCLEWLRTAQWVFKIFFFNVVNKIHLVGSYVT